MNKFNFDPSKVNVSTMKGCIIINHHMMKVVDDFDFVFKLQKTQIRAKGGSEGLAKELQSWLRTDDVECIQLGKFCLSSPEVTWAIRVINHVLNNGKPTLF